MGVESEVLDGAYCQIKWGGIALVVCCPADARLLPALANGPWHTRWRAASSPLWCDLLQSRLAGVPIQTMPFLDDRWVTN